MELQLQPLAALNGQQVEVIHVEGQNVLLDALNHGQVLIAVDLLSSKTALTP